MRSKSRSDMAIEDEVSKELNAALLRLRDLPYKTIREALIWQTMEWCARQLGLEIEKRNK